MLSSAHAAQSLFTVSLKGVPVICGVSGAREQVSLRQGESRAVSGEGVTTSCLGSPSVDTQDCSQLMPVAAAGSPSWAVRMRAQSRLTLRPHELQPARLLCPWDSPGKNTGVGCHFFLQEARAGLCLMPL